MTSKPKARKTKAQIQAGRTLEIYGIVHFLLTEQRVPVMFNSQLAYVACPGVSKEAFRKAIDIRVTKNLVAMLDLGITRRRK